MGALITGSITNSYSKGNITSTPGTTASAGLVAQSLPTANIKNFTLVNPIINASLGGYGIGSVIGWAQNTTMIGVHLQGGNFVSGPYISYAGGLVSYWNFGSITGCTSDAPLNFGPGVMLAQSHTVGGLIGFNQLATMKSCISTGSLTGWNGTIGGLVGNCQGNIYNSYSTSRLNVTGTNAGGLVGYGVLLDVDQSYSTGNINFPNGQNGAGVGGFMGALITGSITNSYSKGNVTSTPGTTASAGLVAQSLPTANIKNCYSIGSIITTGRSDGLDGPGFTTSNSYWNTQTSGIDHSAGGEGKTTTEMYESKTYTNWDFNTIWGINEGQGYPFLLNTK